MPGRYKPNPVSFVVRMNSIHTLKRRHSVPVMVGTVKVGGDAPIVVQSMTNTDTADVTSTTKQVAELARAGSELVRITVNTDEAAAAVPHIRDRLEALGLRVPLIGDFHFNGHKLLKAHPACAAALTKYRINPGNVGRGAKRDTQFAEMIEVALDQLATGQVPRCERGAYIGDRRFLCPTQAKQRSVGGCRPEYRCNGNQTACE